MRAIAQRPASWKSRVLTILIEFSVTTALDPLFAFTSPPRESKPGQRNSSGGDGCICADRECTQSAADCSRFESQWLWCVWGHWIKPATSRLHPEGALCPTAAMTWTCSNSRRGGAERLEKSGKIPIGILPHRVWCFLGGMHQNPNFATTRVRQRAGRGAIDRRDLTGPCAKVLCSDVIFGNDRVRNLRFAAGFEFRLSRD